MNQHRGKRRPPSKPNFNAESFSRRDALRAALGAGVIATLPGCSTAPIESVGRDSIAVENAKPGTREWLLTKTRIDPKSKYRSPWIEGYCSRSSVRAGE